MSTLSGVPPSMVTVAMPEEVDPAKISATHVPVKLNVAVAFIWFEYFSAPPEFEDAVHVIQLPLYVTDGSVSWKVVPEQVADTAACAMKPSRKTSVAPDEAFFVPE